MRYAEADSLDREDTAPLLTVDASEHQVDIHQLLKWTQYKIWVAARTDIGDGPYSDVIFVQTDEDGR